MDIMNSSLQWIYIIPSPIKIKHSISMVPMECGNSLLNRGFVLGGV